MLIFSFLAFFVSEIFWNFKNFRTFDQLIEQVPLPPSNAVAVGAVGQQVTS
jgi:hypothetical protein